MSRVSGSEISRCGVYQKASMAFSGVRSRRFALLYFHGLCSRVALRGVCGLVCARSSAAVGCGEEPLRSRSSGGTLEKPTDAEATLPRPIQPAQGSGPSAKSATHRSPLLNLPLQISREWHYSRLEPAPAPRLPSNRALHPHRIDFSLTCDRGKSRHPNAESEKHLASYWLGSPNSGATQRVSTWDEHRVSRTPRRWACNDITGRQRLPPPASGGDQASRR